MHSIGEMAKPMVFLLILELENRLGEVEGLPQPLTQNSNVLNSGPACHNTSVQSLKSSTTLKNN